MGRSLFCRNCLSQKELCAIRQLELSDPLSRLQGHGPPYIMKMTVYSHVLRVTRLKGSFSSDLFHNPPGSKQACFSLQPTLHHLQSG